MRVLTSTLVALGILAGALGAVAGYRAVTAAPDQKPAAAVEQVHRIVPLAPRVRLLPCERGWTQRGKACVKVVTKVVYSSSASSAGVAAVPAPVVRATAATRPVHRSTTSHAQEPSQAETQHQSEPSDSGEPTGAGSQPAYDD